MEEGGGGWRKEEEGGGYWVIPFGQFHNWSSTSVDNKRASTSASRPYKVKKTHTHSNSLG